MEITIPGKKLSVYNLRNIERLKAFYPFSNRQLFELKVAGRVLPFKVNNYVLEELIDWSDVPHDPIYQLTFLNREMLLPEHYSLMSNALRNNQPDHIVEKLADQIRLQLNPHPGSQISKNVPFFEDISVPGIQHKYRETCLIFPSSGQTCHSYCSFCFRWPQFSSMNNLKFSTDRSMSFFSYIREHREITDILLTGGDPMTMSASALTRFLEPFLQPEFEHIQSIRIGTKSISYWPYRYVTDSDSQQILQLFERITCAGKHLALMAHFNHFRELNTEIARIAIKRIQGTGALIRTQSPILRHINDTSYTWVKLWNEQIKLGCIPYYMFIERDTGSHNYFSLPIYRAFEIFQEAFQKISGLGRTVRGPVMSTSQGKVVVDGIRDLYGEKVFVLSYVQARDASKCKNVFFAKFNKYSTWFNDLKPVNILDNHFFET